MSKEDYPAYIDRRDAEIVGRMSKGDIYSDRQLTKAYKRYTDIRRNPTANQRKNDLFDSPCMEYVSIGRYRFVGFDNTQDLL